MAQSPPGRGRNGGRVLGVNGAFHLTTCALFQGHELLAYGDEERFSRSKRGKRAAVDNADQLPTRALDYCLRAAGIGLADVDLIGYSYDPAQRVLLPGDDVVDGDWGSPSGEAAFQASLARVPAALSELAGVDVRDRFRYVPHHLCHAASAYLASPYDNAAVLSVDGIGETTTMLTAHGQGTRMQVLQEIHYPHSLGFLWEAVSMFLGLDQYEGPGQLMGLAGFGRPDRYAEQFAKILTVDPDGFRIDDYYPRFRAAGDRLHELFGPSRRPGEHMTARDADVAAALQAATEEVLLATAIRLRIQTGADALCLAGGVALNCVAVGRIAREAGYANLFVQPAAGDDGTSLGAALYLLHGELGWPDRWVMEHPYLGQSFSEQAMEQALAATGLTYRREADVAASAARLIADGKLVGWFQGAAEAGPRALGNRSILADPRDPRMLERINLRAGKRRAPWRPVAPSALAEAAPAWMDVGPAASLSHGTMNLTYPVRPEQRQRIPAVVHADGCTRAQLVTPELNPRYHRLISQVHRLTGVPLVVNTSMNGPGEPIVNSPEDAVALYRRTEGGLDALVLGDLLVLRQEAR
jgi:carbamoyltransferase